MKYKTLSYLLLLAVILSACNAKESKTNQVDSFNYILGTQSFSAAYQFTNEPIVLETAKQILEMGSNILKIRLSISDKSEVELTQTPCEIVQEDEVMKEILDMDFYYYHLWVYCRNVNWFDGLSKEEAKAEYEQIYDLTTYLLTKFDKTNKSFYIGHWEGDWYLVDNYNRTQVNVDTIKLKGMIDWYSVRQKAIDDAKHQIKHSAVNVFQYAEVNRVTDDDCDRMVNKVLPYVDIDYVSYSSYESTIEKVSGEDYEELKESLFYALNKIEKQLKPKPHITGKRVYIGEYGYPLAVVGNADSQNKRAKNLIKAGLEWGCPFILYWQMYDNESDKDGNRMGFWLVDDKNKKQPVYNTHYNYFRTMRAEIENYTIKNRRIPEVETYLKMAQDFFKAE